MKAKVVITDFISEPLDIEREILGDLAEVTALSARQESELDERIEDADVVVLYHELSLTRATIERLGKCRLIIRGGVGFDNVDGAAAREKEIDVCNVPDYGTEDVADSAIGMMLTLARGIHVLNSRLRRSEGAWHFSQAAPVRRLRGRAFGIVGIGRIGTAAALRAKALGMDVSFHDPYVPQGVDKALGVRTVDSLAELFERAHVLSLHCPLTPETHHLVNLGTIRLLPPGAILINTARGGVVESAAVIEALERGHLAGAGIDVLEAEPPAPDHPLVRAWRDPHHPAHDRLILTPHSAFYTEEGLADMRIKSSRNARRALTAQRPWNVVN
jgi:C-terminal binding protein